MALKKVVPASKPKTTKKVKPPKSKAPKAKIGKILYVAYTNDEKKTILAQDHDLAKCYAKAKLKGVDQPVIHFVKG
jgi:hypothetical protein